MIFFSISLGIKQKNVFNWGWCEWFTVRTWEHIRDWDRSSLGRWSRRRRGRGRWPRLLACASRGHDLGHPSSPRMSRVKEGPDHCPTLALPRCVCPWLKRLPPVTRHLHPSGHSFHQPSFPLFIVYIETTYSVWQPLLDWG